MEREDFTRLKKVQANKALAAAAEKRENARLAAEAAAKAAAKATTPSSTKDLPVSPTTDLLLSVEKKEIAHATVPESDGMLAGYDAADDDDVVFK